MKILFTPLTGSSIAHIVRSLSLADTLKKRGHEIYFTSCDKKAAFIEDNGYKVYKTYDTVNLNDPLDQSINYLRDNRAKFIGWFKAEIDAAKEIKPDIVVQAGGLFGPHVYHALKVPVINVMDAQYLDESKGLLGISRGTDKLTDKFLLKILKPIFNRKFYNLYLKEILIMYNSLGIKHNIRSKEDIYCKTPVIIPSDDVMQPLSVHKDYIYHVGPIFWKGFEEMDTDITDEFLTKFKEDKLLVYLSFGGSVFDKKIYDYVLNAFAFNGYKAIVSLGPNFSRNEFPEDTKNVVIRNFVPGLKVNKYADVAVNTGAQGTVMQAIVNGKPQVVFPTMIDQSFYANRIEELHIGININKINILRFSKRESYNVVSNNIHSKIVKAVEKIFSDPSYLVNAKRLSDYIKKYGDPSEHAADIVEHYMLNYDNN